MGNYKANRNNNDVVQDTKTQDKRNEDNFAKNIKNAGEVLKKAPHPYAKAAGYAISGLDKITNGKSSQTMGEIANKATKFSPVGKHIQNASNAISESGVSDAVGDVASKINGSPTNKSEGTSKVNDNSSRFNGLKSTFNKSTSTNGDLVGNLWRKLPTGVKIKIAVGGGFCLLLLLMVFTVFAQDDIQNLSLTNSSGMTSKGNVGNADVIKSLEEISLWYIENVATYDQSLYLESPFTTSKVRADCTGFAVAFMSYVSGVDIPISWSGEMIYPDGSWAQNISATGWKAYTSDEIGELQFGDVLVAHSGSLYSTKGQHAEIYVDETHTFGWGSVQKTYPKSNTITKTTSGGHVHFMDSGHDYITIYRYEGSISSDSTNSSNSSSTLNATKMNDSSFNHGTKPKSNQKYIMLHDTEMSQDAKTVVQSWKNSGSGVAAHFVIDRDGTIIQAVELDTITHHAGWGGPGNYDAKFGVGNNDGKGNGDDLVGTSKSGYASYTSYGMNSYSIGIEMCHVNGETYPEAQLEAVDKVIAYIDSYYGFNSIIIDHKEWRPSNSDTDANFATYLNNYKTLRHH